MKTLTQKELEQMNQIHWFHRITLGSNAVTPGNDDTPHKLPEMNIPNDLSGKTVLDIGAWDGFFSFECEKRGAERVVATDEFVWKTRDDETFSEGFDFAHKMLNSKVEKRVVSIESLRDNPPIGSFDIVIMLGVLYHAPDPLGYLRAAFKHTKEMLILETTTGCNELDYPAIQYFPSTSLDGDQTNFWGPNELAVTGMLKDVGFKDVKAFPKHGTSPDSDSPKVRQVFHAYK